MDEDCLYLNVYTPALDDVRRPVMVWIHGGGFIIGSGSTPLYDGAALVERGDVVLVTINYRLGASASWTSAGSMRSWPARGTSGCRTRSPPSSGCGTTSPAFGGDPGNVTIFGESAGGMSVTRCSPPRRPRALPQGDRPVGRGAGGGHARSGRGVGA